MNRGAVLHGFRWDRALLVLLGAGLAVRLALAVPVFTDVSRTAACYDALAYDQIARNLLDGHGFSKSPLPPYELNSTITPGYPFFVAGVYAVFGRLPVVVVLIQILLNLVVLGVLYRFVRERFSAKAALWMGVFFTADLNMALFCAQLTSETLFTLLLLGALMLILKSVETGRLRLSVGAGALLGAATLVRPIALYFTLPVLLFILVSHRRRHPVRLTRKLLQWGVIIGLQVAFIVPWVVRNRLAFGETFYTTVSDVNMLRYHAAPLKAALEHKPRMQAQEELEEAALEGESWSNEARYFRLLGSEAKRYVLRHPLPYLASLVMGGVVSLVYPLPMRETGVYFRGEEALPELSVAQSAMLETLKGRIVPALRTAWRERLRYYGAAVFALFLVYAAFHLLKLGCGLRAYILRGLRDPLMLLFLLTGMYFMGLLGFGVSPRMRVPVEPLLVSLAGIGIASRRAGGRGAKRKVGGDAED